MFEDPQNAATKLSVKEKSSGKEIASHTSAKEFRMFMLSSKEIETEKEYILYVNDEEYQTITATDGTTFVGSGAGMMGGFGGGRGGFGK